MTTTRYVCIHGHFYQPPRENPWLEVVETQDSAFPYHDWNHRITDECYAPNTASPILADDGSVRETRNNYAGISFNFGPTLLSWLQTERADVYGAILAADAQSAERFSGHGSALAQVYNHTILPLASRRDKETQVRWGIADFEKRFGRKPEGMWLAETAVDTETLEVLAAHDIAFTVLAPRQAARVQRDGVWEAFTVADTRRPHRIELPSGRSVDAFFYDGEVSQAVAFEKLLASGAALTERLLSAHDPDSDEPELVHIATDGETYGHHHRHGDMALAWTLAEIERREDVVLTNYGEFRSRFPATTPVEINEPSSWSCVHGVERWRSDCGCHTGGEPGWHQKWRAPLRRALDRLSSALNVHFERAAVGLLRDPWRARDAYIRVILDRSPKSVDAFFKAEGARRLAPRKRVEALRLLEMQRNGQLMYTSCGWFFSEVSGTEGVQVLRYAARAIDLAQRTGLDVERQFLVALEDVPTNRPVLPSGRDVYERLAATARVTGARGL